MESKFTNKKLIRLTESELKNVVKEIVKKVLKEDSINESIYNEPHISDKSLKAMEKAFTRIPGQKFIDMGAKVIKGHIDPDKYYIQGYYNWNGNNLFTDAIIEMPNGTRHTLMKK